MATVVYVDGIFDLFHRGHLEALRKAKAMRPNVKLIVGVFSDVDSSGYKRDPIYNEDDRYNIIQSIRIVDQVVFPAPFTITEEFMKRYGIDIVVHGFSDMQDASKQSEFFAQIKDKFEMTPYYSPCSTTAYIKKIQDMKHMTNVDDICTIHGGAVVHEIENLQVDMSVTTNCNMVDGFYETHDMQHLTTHYPKTGNDVELIGAYNQFHSTSVSNVLFGNGATELIDLVLRKIPKCDWKTNNVITQYREYRNCNVKQSRKQLPWTDKSAKLTIIINPNNPTGDFLNWSDMVEFINEYVADDSHLIIDESMLFWFGEKWMNHSFLGHLDYIKMLQKNRNIKTIVIQSWTKIFSSTGLRIGSAFISDTQLFESIKREQPPWSLNSVARAYLLYAWKQKEYLQNTWDTIRNWRYEILEQIQSYYPNWTPYGADFLSWIWIDTHNMILAESIVLKSKQLGFPIRHGREGYNMDTYIRIAVRDPNQIKKWLNMLSQTKQPKMLCLDNVKKQVVVENKMVPISSIKIHENYIVKLVDSLYGYIVETDFSAPIPSIIIALVPDSVNTYFIVDGHHRMEVMKRLGHTEIPATIIDYNSDLIFNDCKVSKNDVLDAVKNNRVLAPKSTKHSLHIANGFVPISTLGDFMIGGTPLPSNSVE